uniref:Uncharacterized protein n=1 Tax=Rhizophora mucronata TaxID=61149 RepID=A0A2P2IJ39_RHIMU
MLTLDTEQLYKNEFYPLSACLTSDQTWV